VPALLSLLNVLVLYTTIAQSAATAATIKLKVESWMPDALDSSSVVVVM
jgi:hypothetical protein